MGRITLSEILQATGGKAVSAAQEEFASVSIDSRTVEEGEVFFALKGSRFDGNDFVYDALKKASGAVVSRVVDVPTGKSLIVVEDTLKALQALAGARRKKRNIPVVGITGSNGKTTTKEMTASILGLRKNILKNTGNLNNQIGLPLTLTALNSVHDAVVLEMGASARGDIKELCEISSPTHGVFTNVGSAHLEGFGTRHALRDTKLELLGYVGTAVVNADDGFLMEGLHRYQGRIISYAVKNKADVMAEDIRQGKSSTSFMLRTPSGSTRVSFNATGLFNVYNALAASSVAFALEMTPEEIATGLEGFSPVSMRFNVKSSGEITYISDVYNANPDSVAAALRELAGLAKGRTVAVLGDMLELGQYAEEAHREVGRFMNDLNVGLFIAVGPLMTLAADVFNGEKMLAKTAKEAAEMLRSQLHKGDTVLIKGSRGMKMEEALPDAL